MKTSPSPYRRSLLVSLSCLMMALAACGLPSLPGSFSVNTANLLPTPSAGLEGLQSYHAVYDLSLHGTLNGKPFDRQSHMDYRLVSASKDKEIVWQEQQAGSLAVFLHTIRVGNSVYTLSQDGQECWGEYVDQPSEAVPSPDSLLLPVTHANPVGSETVNGVATQHYHFDQTGVSAGGAGTSGEVWVAQQGGFVVKYTLSIPRPTAPTGQGAEISETLSYEIKEVNSFNQMSLPGHCVPVLVDFPTMADAQNLYRGSGYMDYTSPSTLAQVVDFYNGKLPSLGWTPVKSPLPSDKTGSQALEFTQGNQVLTVLMANTAGSLEVSVVLNNPALAAPSSTETPGPTPTSGPLPTANASQSGLPSDVPLYPGATGLIANPGVGVEFSTNDPPDSVAKYYRDQLTALKWVLQNEVKPDANTDVQSWMKSNRILLVNITVKNGATDVMLGLHSQ